MRRVFVSLLLLSTPMPVLACDLPLHSPYDQPDSRAVDATAGAMAVLPTYATIGLCGALMLPADIYGKVERPADDFGTHASSRVCNDAGKAVGCSIYRVGAFPISALRLTQTRRLPVR